MCHVIAAQVRTCRETQRRRGARIGMSTIFVVFCQICVRAAVKRATDLTLMTDTPCDCGVCCVVVSYYQVSTCRQHSARSSSRKSGNALTPTVGKTNPTVLRTTVLRVLVHKHRVFVNQSLIGSPCVDIISTSVCQPQHPEVHETEYKTQDQILQYYRLVGTGTVVNLRGVPGLTMVSPGFCLTCRCG